MPINQWMIYGANGYTGELVAREAADRGHQPILAGRSESAVLDLAEELDLKAKAFALDHPRKIKDHLDGIGLVLNCAGPFSKTAETLRQACIELGVHYLDITGEIPVLEDSYNLHEQAKEAGSVVISGVGFDVVPTDTLANLLKQALPTASHLQLAFAGDGGVSPGTAKTMVEMMPDRGQIREAGRIKQVPLAYKSQSIQFSDEARFCATIPWGDISTAYNSTSIDNIEVYTAIPESQVKMMRKMNAVVGLLSINWVQNLLKKMIGKNVHGPEKSVREIGFMRIWGQVTDGNKTVEMTMDTAEGYDYTVLSSLLFVESLIADKVMPGAYTPAQALPLEAMTEMEGVTIKTVRSE